MADKKVNRFLNSSVFVILIALLFAGIAIGAHVITTSTGGTSYNFNEDVSNLAILAVNNTNAGQGANITGVNVTVPSSFTFAAATNGSNATVYDFVINGKVASWNNTGDYLVNGSEMKIFWINVTAATPGTYNITVNVTNATAITITNITVIINDTTAPDTMGYGEGTENSTSNITRNNIIVNVTATDNGVIDTILVRLYNSSNSIVNTTRNATANAGYLYLNLTGLADGFYYFNATVNDTYGNSNTTSTRNLTIDRTAPAVTISSFYTNSTGLVTLNASVIDASVGTISDVYFNVTNLTGTLKAIVNGTKNTGSYYYNTTGLNVSTFTEGIYIVRVLANDTLNNLNNSGLANITIDRTAPAMTISEIYVSSTNATFNISITESGSGISQNCTVNRTSTITFNVTGTNTSQSFGESGLACNSEYNYTVTCVDNARNSNYTIASATTSACTTSTTGTSSSTGSTNGNSWKNTYVYNSDEFKNLGQFRRTLVGNSRASIKLNGATHYVGVTKVSAGSVDVEVSSTPQTATIGVGKNKKFDVDGDGYYDIDVKLFSVNLVTQEADISTTYIHEQVLTNSNDTVTNATETGSGDDTAATPDVTQKGNKNNSWIWIVIGVVILLAIAFVIYLYSNKKNR